MKKLLPPFGPLAYILATAIAMMLAGRHQFLPAGEIIEIIKKNNAYGLNSFQSLLDGGE